MLAFMRGWAVAVVALVVGLTTTADDARAQAEKPTKSAPVSMKDRIEAKRLFNQAHLAYKNGDYEEAILKWQQSYERSKEPLIFESIANGYERLGNFRRALESLKQWRQAAPWREQSTLDGRIQRLEARAAEEDAEKVRKDAEALKRDEAKRAKDADERRRRDEAAQTMSKVTILGWSLLGAGGVFAMTGVGLDIYAVTRRPDAATACASSGGVDLCLDSHRSAIERSNALAIAGDTGWIAGAALSTAGLVLLLTSPNANANQGPTENGATATATPWVGPSGGGVTVRGSF